MGFFREAKREVFQHDTALLEIDLSHKRFPSKKHVV